MGYYMTQRDTYFMIERKNYEEAAKAVQTLDGEYSWVRDFHKPGMTLPEILLAWRWEAGEDKEGNTLYQGWALVIYGDLAPVEKALRAELEWMWENLSGCDWCPECGGGESRRDLYQRILAGMGVPPWTAPEDDEE